MTYLLEHDFIFFLNFTETSKAYSNVFQFTWKIKMFCRHCTECEEYIYNRSEHVHDHV